VATIINRVSAAVIKPGRRHEAADAEACQNEKTPAVSLCGTS
jgi:hypothetical protein